MLEGQLSSLAQYKYKRKDPWYHRTPTTPSSLRSHKQTKDTHTINHAKNLSSKSPRDRIRLNTTPVHPQKREHQRDQAYIHKSNQLPCRSRTKPRGIPRATQPRLLCLRPSPVPPPMTTHTPSSWPWKLTSSRRNCNDWSKRSPGSHLDRDHCLNNKLAVSSSHYLLLYIHPFTYILVQHTTN